jgi:hypothetical protein
MESLTEKVLRYQRTRSGLSEIMSDVAQRVYFFPRRRMGWDDDACGDFYLFFHPRLVRLLDRFRDQGKPFESYLCAVLAWQLRNFARERKRGERSWNVALRIEPGESHAEAADTSARWNAQAALPAGGCEIAQLIRTGADRRNLLFLILKCSRTLEEGKAAALAELAGVSKERLAGLMSELSQLREDRDVRLETFRRRRNGAFALVRLLETELVAESEEARREELLRRLAKARLRMRGAMTRMARVGLAPTNKEISRILGVPKGTVDSGLYWLKKKLARAYDPDSFRSA